MADMKATAVRLAVLLPLALSLLSLLRPFFPDGTTISQLFMSPSTAFGLSALSIAWYLYVTGHRYGRILLLALGSVSLAVTSLVLASYFLDFRFPLQTFIVPSNTSPFLLNLTYMFLACYIIQVATYWMPRTLLLVNGALATILFMAMLSVFGRLYDFDGIQQEALLIPMPLAAILGFLILALAIFVHTNHMERLYLSGEIVISFALMFVAIIGANIVVYGNINKTVNASAKIDAARHILASANNVNFYLGNAQKDVQAYRSSGVVSYLESYEANKQSYNRSVTRLKERTISGPDNVRIRRSVHTIATLGNQILSLEDQAIQQKTTGPPTANDTHNTQIISYTDQLTEQTKTVSLVYTNQLNQLIEKQSYNDRGIVIGVSVTSAVSLLLIIFTPLFIRQTIQILSITQHQLKRSNRLLSEEKSRAEAILAGIGDGLYAVDIDHTITLFNQAAEKITGLKKEAVLGQHFEDVMHFGSSKDGSAPDFTAKALQGIESHLTHDVILKRKDKNLDVQVSASPIKNLANSVVGAIVVFRNRTSEQELENAKDEFVSLASHQLRTPAAATKQFLAMFLQGYAGTIDNRQRRFLQEAYDNNQLGINIIEELLNITRLESNKLNIIKEKIELGSFLRKAVKQHRPLADRSGQSLKLLLPQKPLYLDTDASLLAMALDNLITNALKYSTEAGHVTIKLTNTPHISIAITDTGIGIKAKDQAKIFERFGRIEDPHTQHISGTGTGLYLVRKIVKKLHATIKVESTYGQGSTFTLEFKTME